MKLESIDKVLNIKVEYGELSNYLKELDSVITKFQDGSGEMNELKRFSLKLTKILHSARDY